MINTVSIDDYKISFNLDENRWIATMQRGDTIYQGFPDFNPINPFKAEQLDFLIKNYEFKIDESEMGYMVSTEFIPIINKSFEFELENENIKLKLDNEYLKARVKTLEEIVMHNKNLSDKYYCTIVVKWNRDHRASRHHLKMLLEPWGILNPITIHYWENNIINTLSLGDSYKIIDLLNEIIRIFMVKIEYISMNSEEMIIMCDYGPCQKFVYLDNKYARINPPSSGFNPQSSEFNPPFAGFGSSPNTFCVPSFGYNPPPPPPPHFRVAPIFGDLSKISQRKICVNYNRVENFNLHYEYVSLAESVDESRDENGIEIKAEGESKDES